MWRNTKHINEQNIIIQSNLVTSHFICISTFHHEIRKVLHHQYLFFYILFLLFKPPVGITLYGLDAFQSIYFITMNMLRSDHS